VTAPLLMKPARWRRLTPGERALALTLPGAAFDPDGLRLVAAPWLRRAFVPGSRLIVWPAATAWTDFAQAPLELQAVFVHELAHVWQARTGVFLPWAKLRAGDGARAYAYDLETERDFSSLNIEQQAMVIQHAFLAARGGAAPYGARVYKALLDA
jgi:hypothetical protein